MQPTAFIHKKVLALSVEHSAENMVLRSLFAVACLLLIGYLYFVSASILNVMARKEALGQASSLQSETANLEQRYFTLSQAMTLQAAQELGLAPIGKADYVYRPGSVGLADISNSAI